MDQFNDPMVRILSMAGIISFVISYSSQNKEDDLPAWIEPFVIFIIIVLNSMVGIYQDYNADRSLQALKEMQNKYTKVLREGWWNNINTQELTIGDVVEIGQG